MVDVVVNELLKVFDNNNDTNVRHKWSITNDNHYDIEIGQFSQEAIVNMQRLLGFTDATKYVIKITCSLTPVYNGSKYLQIFGKYDGNRTLSESTVVLKFQSLAEILSCLGECQFV